MSNSPALSSVPPRRTSPAPPLCLGVTEPPHNGVTSVLFADKSIGSRFMKRETFHLWCRRMAMTKLPLNSAGRHNTFSRKLANTKNTLRTRTMAASAVTPNLSDRKKRSNRIFRETVNEKQSGPHHLVQEASQRAARRLMRNPKFVSSICNTFIADTPAGLSPASLCSLPKLSCFPQRA